MTATKSKAFTLAEAVITIGIVGIVEKQKIIFSLSNRRIVKLSPCL